MNQDNAALEAIVAEVETVFAKHGVSGAVVVSSELAHAYGLHYPEGSPLTLQGKDDVRSEPISWVHDPKHMPFLISIHGLMRGTATIADSCRGIFDLLVASVKREIVRRASRES